MSNPAISEEVFSSVRFWCDYPYDKAKRVMGEQRTQQGDALVARFGADTLRAWIADAEKRNEKASKRYHESFAGGDLFDAMRGVYDQSACIRLINEALARKA